MTERAGEGVTTVLDALALGWLVCVAMLTAWSVLPMAWGWHPSVVVSGSMAPRILPGDVVLVDHNSTLVRKGSIVLARDPAAPSGRVMHRVVGTDALGLLITRGDANPSDDSHHRSRGDVEGMARLVVPRVGQVALLRSGRGRPATWVWPAVTVACGIWLARPKARGSL